MITESLLIEIGTEELPPKGITPLSQQFKQLVEQQLQVHQFDHGTVEVIAAPRRFGLIIHDLIAKQPDKSVEKKGPAVQAAFDPQGQPTPAALGWAKSNGIDISQAERLTTAKGEWLLHRYHQVGKTLVDVLPTLVAQATQKLSFTRPMRWGSEPYQFIRPIHTLTLLYGSDVIPGELFGVKSTAQVQGHRFHSAQLVTITHAKHYLQQLNEHYVIAKLEDRKQKIIQLLQQQTQTNEVLPLDDSLVHEVSCLVEWPVVYRGTFNSNYLKVPQEALIMTMQDNQKYFPLLTQEAGQPAQLKAEFLFVSNIDSNNPSAVISGNEKVVTPRLADAEFFYHQDLKIPLSQWVEKLHLVTFQQQLGSILDKTQRNIQLALFIAQQLQLNSKAAELAAYYAKADLTTNMVFEFPELQGIMGNYYLQAQLKQSASTFSIEEQQVISSAIEQHYWPKFSGDLIPQSSLACCIALADKLDTIVSIFSIGKAPKSDKDPFALRRQALGVLRIVVEGQLSLDLQQLIEYASTLLPTHLKLPDGLVQQVMSFFTARQTAYYQEQGFSADELQAVNTISTTQPLLFSYKLKSVQYFKQLPAATALAAANKRVSNLLAKVDQTLLPQVDVSRLQQQVEQDLYQQVQKIEQQVATLVNQHHYQQALVELSTLQQIVDHFFDEVMVMVDDIDLRHNRLALLVYLRQQFLQIADISKLQPTTS